MAASAPPPSPGTRGRFTAYGLPPLHYLGHWQHQPPVWLEGRGAVEYLRLLRHPLYRGIGAPNGAGAPVLLVPGLMAGDGSLSVLRNWLVRSGYHVEQAGLVFNVRYSELVLGMISSRLRAMHLALHRKVTIVGHSRGGLLAKVIGDREPGSVRGVVTLGSPLGDPFDVHPLTMAGVRLAHAINVLRYARGGAVERAFLEDLEAPARVPLTSIYSRTDGIVHWEACLRPDARCIEVVGSHLGLGVNLQVYELLAAILPHGPAAPKTVRKAAVPARRAAGKPLGPGQGLAGASRQS
jgi:triacylglycerol lipase